MLEAEGQARAIKQVFDAIHRGKPTQKLLAYQYLQTLPQIARGDANKMWIIPSELTDALRGIGGMLGSSGDASGTDVEEFVEVDEPENNAFEAIALQDPRAAREEARGQVARSTREATEHAAPISAPQPPSRPPADAVPPPPPPPPAPEADAQGGPSGS